MPVDEYFTEMHAAWERATAAVPETERGEMIGPFIDRYTASARPVDATGVAVEDTAIDGPHGPIGLRTYTPEGPLAGSLLWAHGGGFLSGDLDMLEGHMVSMELARRARVAVVSVDYRLARDGVRHPVPIDDVHAAWNWWSDREPHRGLPRAIGGASAEGALAAAAAMRLRDEGERLPEALLLAYPWMHFPVPALTPSLSAEMTAVPWRFDPLGLEWAVRNYVGRTSDLPPDALPGAGRLDGLPPARIVVSEYDDLRPSAELFERQLAEAGVAVESYVAAGMTHGHLNHPASVPEVGRSLDFLASGWAAS
ncbi:alpha/beta hydrolase fold domain-containing protein [Glycomyces terrestris]|uniref:Alpha/beta hydrolase n=1 Tax=Glycomyces terrestris TaxID=2493553 RepID=A0A426V371_9ACTN|nr:alpha/beta hydrolase [Glycomyces terrestris]RRS01260.1 alpha/beta hydrolase [Glycomyces terrestris]